MTLQHTPSPAFADDEPLPALRRSRRQSPRKERVLVAQKRYEMMERESRREVEEFFSGYEPMHSAGRPGATSMHAP